MKIVLIGAGSRCFGRGQIADLLAAQELRDRAVTLTLVDENKPALELMARLAQRMKKKTGSKMEIEESTDRRKALRGADYVILAVARKRYELWEQDFRVPLTYGFRHCLGENGGPGALFHALRSLQIVMPVCEDIERIAPNALLLNFTNPEARVLHAILHLTKVKAAGICHGVFAALEAIERYLGRPLDELEVVSAGMNHFYHILKVRDRSTGKDLWPALRRKALADKNLPPLYRKLLEIFGIFTYTSDDHIGEYLSFGSEFHGVKWVYGRECHKVTLEEKPANDLPLEEYADGRRPIDGKILAGSGEVTVPIICDIELDRKAVRPAVNVLNTELYIENLPAHAAVEVPAMVDAAGIHPLRVGALPEAWAAWIRTQVSIHALLTEAWRTKSKNLLLQALLLDPVVNSITATEKMLDCMLELQSEFLPKFS